MASVQPNPEPEPEDPSPPLALPRRVAGWAAIVEGALGGRPDKTRESYERSLREWTDWCAADRLEPLQARGLDVQRWVDELAARHKPRTVARKCAALKAAYKVALREEVVHRNPAEGVRTPKVDQRMTTAVALSEDHLVRFAETAVAAGVFERAVMMLYFTTGLRASEPANADVDDFRDDVDPPVLWVTRKGGHRVDVQLAADTAAALADYIGDRRRGPLLVNPRTGDRLSRFAARRIVMRLAKKAQLPRGVTTHTFRHAHVTEAGDLGVPLEAVQDSAGHASPETTRHYDRGRKRRAHTTTETVAGWLQLRLDGTTEPEPAQNSRSVRPDCDDSGG